MYTDIEQQLNKITDGLKQELLGAKAIDESGHATDVKKFNQILGEKIAQCNAILATTEKDGVTQDLYGAKIAYARVDILKKMKELGTIVPKIPLGDKEKLSSEKKRKIQAFNSEFSKLIAKIKYKFGLSNTIGNNR